MSQKTKSRKNQPRIVKSGDQNSPVVLIAAKAIILGLAVCAGLMIFFAKILSSANIPLYAAVPFATLAASISVLVAAFHAGKSVASGSFIWGILLACCFYGIILICGLLYGVKSYGPITATRIFAMLFSGGLGGYLGARSRAKRQLRRLPQKN